MRPHQSAHVSAGPSIWRRSSRPVGFTFVEILVAMGVFGALTAIAVPRYREFKERAYLSALRSQLGEIRVAEEAHWAEQHLYTTNPTDLDWKSSSNVVVAIAASNPATGYIATVTHLLLSGRQCVTAVGAEATTAPSGEIVCGPIPAGGSGPGVAPAS